MKVVALSLILIGLVNVKFVCGQEDTRIYERALGGRLGLLGKQSVYSDIDLLSASYKQNFTRKSAFEVNVGWGLKPVGGTQTVHGVSFSANYQYHFPIATTGIRPFIGAGAVIIYSTGKKSEIREAVNEFHPGIYPIFGIDYKSRRNFNMALDLRPTNVFY